MAIFHIIYKGTTASQDAILQKLPISFFGQIEEDLHKICLWEDIQEKFSDWIQQLVYQLKTKHILQGAQEDDALWEQIEDTFLHQRMQEVCSYRLEAQKGEAHVLSFADTTWDTHLEIYVVLQESYGTSFITWKQDRFHAPNIFEEDFVYDRIPQELEILQKMMQQMLELPWSDAYFEGVCMQKEYEAILPYLMLFVLKAPIFKIHSEQIASVLH